MTVSARIEADFDDPREGRAIREALEVEADQGPEGSSTRVRWAEPTLGIDVEAADLSTLRAALHSVLRLLDAAESTARVSKKA